ncbi:hypothetical protein GJ496_005131 [Pomphorhynchus laevis]|nr:hypothetical protein GJ496_005131 [Pomphorhynchus laevis]
MCWRCIRALRPAIHRPCGISYQRVKGADGEDSKSPIVWRESDVAKMRRCDILPVVIFSPTENSDTLIQNPPDYDSSEYSLDNNREEIMSFRYPAPTGNSNTVRHNHSDRGPSEYNIDDNEQRARPKHSLDETNVRDLVFPIDDSEVHANNPLIKSKRQRHRSRISRTILSGDECYET